VARFTTAGGGTSGGAGIPAGSAVMSDDVLLFADVSLPDPLGGKSDSPMFDLAAAYAETLAAPADAQALFADTTLADTRAVPTDARNLQIVAGATTVTQTTGTGWQNPANAQGLPNAVNATINAPAAVGGATVTGTLTGVYASVGSVANDAALSGSITLLFTGTVTVGALATGNVQVQVSTNAGGAYTTLATLTASGALGSHTITGVTPATLDQLRFRVVASHTPSATGASGTTLDAVTVTFNTATV
jgi:hypothetical protein